MPTPDIVPRAAGEGNIGSTTRPWGGGYFGHIQLVLGGVKYPAPTPLYGVNEAVVYELSGTQPTIVYELLDPLTIGSKRKFSVEGAVQLLQTNQTCNVNIEVLLYPENVSKEINIRGFTGSGGVSIPFSLSLFATKNQGGNSFWHVIAQNNNGANTPTILLYTVELLAYMTR